MADRPLKLDGRGPAVRALQFALNRRAETRFYPPLIVDSELGPATMRAFDALGWALGLSQEALDAFWRDTMRNPADNLGCPLWLAAYVKDPVPFIPKAWTKETFALWQYTESGRSPGVDGPVDVNRVRGGVDTLSRLRM